MFSNMKIYAAGQLVENIEELGVLASIIDRTKPDARRLIESAMAHPVTDGVEARTPIVGGASRRLIFDLPAGLFKCGKLLPLHLLQLYLCLSRDIGNGSKMAPTSRNPGAEI